MGGGRIEVIVELLAVFAVVSFMSSDAEEALLEDRVDAIPKPQAKTEPLVIVAKTGEAVFTPSVCTRSGVCMRKVRPGVAVGRVVFTNSSLHLCLRTDVTKKEDCAPIVFPRDKDPSVSSGALYAHPEQGGGVRHFRIRTRAV
jgi:hypothetical protein